MNCNSIFLIPSMLEVMKLRVFRLIADEIKINDTSDKWLY